MAKKIQFTPETDVEAVANTPVDFTPENVDPSGDSFNVNDVIKLKPEQYRGFRPEDKTGPDQVINPITQRPDNEGFWSKALNLPEARKDTRADNVMFSSGIDYSQVDKFVQKHIPGLTGDVLGKIGEFIAATPEGILSDPMSPALGLLGASRPRPIQKRLNEVKDLPIEPLPAPTKLKTTLTAEGNVVPKPLVSPEEFTGQQTIKALEGKPLETLKPAAVEQPTKIDFVPEKTVAAQSSVAPVESQVINDIVPESTANKLKALFTETEGSFKPQELVEGTKKALLKLRGKSTSETDTIRTQLLDHLVNVGRIDVNSIYKQVEGKLNPTQFDKILNDIIDSGDLQKAYKSKTSSMSSVGAATAKTQPVSLQDSLNSLTDAISQHQQARLAQDEIVRSEKSTRAGKLESFKGQGYEGYQQQREALKGEYSKVDVTPIKDAISNVNMSAIMNMVDDKIPDVYQSFRAKQAVEKAFGLSELKGALQPNEISLLEKVFGPKITQQLTQMNSVFGVPEGEYSQVGKDFAKWGNLSKSIQSAYDLSAPLRQGVPMMLRKEFYPALIKMFKYAGSEKSYQELQSFIKNDWKYKDLAKSVKLAVTDIASDMKNLPVEEHFISALPEKIPGGLGKLYRGSERAYTGFMDKARVDIFTSLIDDLQRAGIKTHETVHINTAEGIKAKVVPSQEAIDAAKFVNTASGRGSLGKAERYGDLLNTFFYSPRFQVSRLDLMTKFLRPDTYTKLNPIIRREYLKSLLAMGGVAATTNGIGYALGGKLTTTPTSSDFGKIVYHGKTRQDPGAGFNQYLTLAARMVYNGSTSTNTGKWYPFNEGFKPETRLSTLGRFARTKLSPTAGFVGNALAGEDVTGKEFDWTDPTNTAKLFVPLLVQDIYKILKEDPKAWPLIAPATLGQGISVYEDLKKKKAKQSGSFLGRELKRTN